MQRILVCLSVIGLFLAACSPPSGPVILLTEVVPTPAEQTPAEPTAGAPAATPTEAPTPVEVPQAANAAVQALAQVLGLDLDEIKVVKVEAMEWSDSCLGIVRIDALCAQGLVPGYRVSLEANGLQYEFHTNEDGTAHALAPVTVETTAEAAVNAARAALAKALGLSNAEISVVSVAPGEWPDACLGVTVPGMGCAQVITPGYTVVLEANGVAREYHTDAAGASVQPASVGLSWQRHGGIAGFCDELLVYRSGEVVAHECATEKVSQGTLAAMLSEADLAKFNEWLTRYGQVRVAHDDGAVADSMSVTLNLNGSGAEQPSEAEQQAMIAWAQNLYGALQPAG